MTGRARTAIRIASFSACLLASSAALAQKAGGILRLYHNDNPPSASLHEEVTISTLQPFMPVFNNLVMFDQQKKQQNADTIVPDLATEWSWSPDSTKLTFKLRDGVKFHDGKPMTSADVKCTWDWVTAKKESGWRKDPRKEWYFNLKEVTTNGDNEVSFQLERPQPSFLTFLAAGFSAVYPCHVSARDMRSKPIGTGPFKVVDFKPNDGIKLAKNTDYWKPGRPYLDGIEYKIISNRSTRMLAFMSGEFDMTFSQDISIPLARDVKAQVPTAICEVNAVNLRGELLVNHTAPPFDNDKVRRAMMLTIDRKAFVDILSEGTDRIGGTMLAPPDGSWGLKPEQLADVPGFTGDPEKNREEGRRLMRELGYGPDKPLKIKVATRNIPLYRDPAVLLIDHLKHIYIEGELDVLDTTIWYAKLARKDFHVGMNVGGTALDDPDVMFYETYACGSERNYTSYCNKDMQSRFDQESSELDPLKRKALVNAIDHDLQIEGVRPAIYHVRMNVCRHAYVKGITFAQSSQYNHWRLEDAWLDK